jgi:LysR family transcriptional regulator, transcriptional activator of nhaA
MQQLPHLNYQHLLYFWTVAKRGSVTAASAALRLAPSTVSSQIKLLEAQLGEPLLRRRGRSVAVTEAGAVVFRYADEIFRLGKELVTSLGGEMPSRPFMVGMSDVVPKLVASRLLAPVFSSLKEVRIVCEQERPERLFAQLAVHTLDIVIHDAPLPPRGAVRGFSHLLGESTMTVFGSPELARAHKRNFPRSLHDAPFLVPTPYAALRTDLERWSSTTGIRPRIRAELHDSALLKSLAELGVGLFCAPTVIAHDIESQYGVRALGEIPQLIERYYVVSVDRRMRHPAANIVLAIARKGLFA